MELSFDNTTVAGEIQPVEEYDIVADREELNKELVNSDEIDALCSQLDVYSLDTIVKFGSGAAEEIAKSSDNILKGIRMSDLDESNELFKSLAKIMEKFDIDEIKDSTGFLGKLFGNVKKQLDKTLDKYTTMGAEVDKIYIQLRGYEDEIKKSNKQLEMMFEANVACYHELVKYILAGEQGCKEIEAFMKQRQQDMETTGDASISFELTTLKQALVMLEQRTQDLRIAEAVAMQSIPMIRTMEFNNYNLVRKINSAFIVTLPVFKQALAQAILLKRQRIQAQAMSELDKKTNRMLLKNAQAASELTVENARMSSGSSVQIETLQSAFNTITSGISETQRIQEDARRKRVDDQKKLEAIKADFNNKYHAPSMNN